MFSNKNKTKLTKIVFTSIAFISFVITIGIIVNNKTYDLPQKRVNNAPIESSVKRKPKIFCVITTRAENHGLKAVHVKNTWAKRCDRFIFLSSEHNEDLPAIKVCNEEDRNHLWCKVSNKSFPSLLPILPLPSQTKNGLQYIHDQFGDDFDWFLKADDDSYIIIDNLRHFLSNYSPESPLYFGCKFQLNDVVYMSGGAGYVLSRQSLKRFIQRLSVNSTDDQSCRADTDIGAEDVELGRCLRSAGVVAGLHFNS